MFASGCEIRPKIRSWVTCEAGLQHRDAFKSVHKREMRRMKPSEVTGHLLHRSRPSLMRENLWASGAGEQRRSQRVCSSLALFPCVCTWACPSSLQMGCGRAKRPLDDTLPVRVCLQTHLATVIRSNRACVRNSLAHVGWFVESVLQILLFISQKTWEPIISIYIYIYISS